MTTHDSNPHIPNRLERELQSAFGSRPEFPGVTPEVDLEVLGMAQRVAQASIRRRYRHRKNLAMGAAAAMIAGAVTAWIIWPQTRGVAPVHAPATMAAAGPGDLNGDGRVDMLDALILAEEVRSGSAGYDANGDGRVDRADADALAARAVKLERGTL